MNTPPDPSFPTPQPPPVPAPPAVRYAESLEFRPLERSATFFTVVEALLKQPGSILHECRAEGGGKVRALLGAAALLCLGVFGLLLGGFSGGSQFLAAPVKVMSGMVACAAICLPSFYIFTALGGVEARFSQVAGVLLAAVAVTSLLLVGFAPVLWIFGQSTESVAFMGLLALSFWIISLLFGFRLLFAAASRLGMKSGHFLVVWMGLFLLVTLQMSTALRPIIGTAPTLLPTEKKFFLAHWFSEMGLMNAEHRQGRDQWDSEQAVK